MTTKYFETKTQAFSTLNEAERDLANSIYVEANIVTVYNIDGSITKYNHIELRLSDYMDANEIFKVFDKLRSTDDFVITTYDVKYGVIKLETKLITEKINSYLIFDDVYNDGKNTEVFTTLAIHEASKEVTNILHKILIDSMN